MESETDYESDKSEDNRSLTKPSVSCEEKDIIGNNVVSEEEIKKQKLYRELLHNADERLNSFKSKLMVQLTEAFKIFDIDRDGIIGEKDLKYTFSSLGEKDISDKNIRSMIEESPTPIDFKTFVGLFISKEMEFDEPMDLVKAFSKWDDTSCGYMHEDRFKRDLQTRGKRLSEKEIDCALEEAPIYGEDGKTVIDYIEFCANFCGMQNIQESEL